MRFSTSDRTRVSRVRVTSGGRVREIRGCWISVNTDRKQLGIWLDSAAPGPAITVPLADAQIEWDNRQARDEPTLSPLMP